MSSGPFGQYQSQTTQQLAQISSSKYPDTNKDFEDNLARLNVFVDYIAQYLQTMQKGVDQANLGTIDKVKSFGADLVILLGGGELFRGLDLGDLQYYLPAIGALLGFDADTPFPINLLNAAEHFFLGYVVPLDAFGAEIEDLIINFLTGIGFPPDVLDSLLDVFNAIQDVTTDAHALFATIKLILTDMFGLDPSGDNTALLAPLADLWHAVTQLLSANSLQHLVDLADPVLEHLAPWIEDLATWLENLDTIIKAFTGGVANLQGIVNFGGMLAPYINLIPSGTFNPLATWTTLFQQVLTSGGLQGFVDAISQGFGGVTGLDFPGLQGFLSGLPSAQGITDAIANALGLSGSGHTPIQVLAYLGNAFQLFGSPDLSGAFNLNNAAQGLLQNVLTPAGALSTFTQIPPHLLAQFLPGGASTNLLPDPSFADASALAGDLLWTWSSTGRNAPGSAQTTGSSLQKVLMSVAIPCNPGDTLNLETYAKWTGFTGSTAQGVVLACNAYKSDDTQISDPSNRVIQGLSSLTSASTSYAGQVSGWVHLSGDYQAPALTSYVRLILEVESTVTGGTFNFDDCVVQLPSGIWDAAMLRNVANIPQLLATSVEGFEGLSDMLTSFGHLFDGLTSGFNLDTVTGTSSSDVFSGAQAVANLATLAHNLATTVTQIIGIRINKNLAFGADPTSEAMVTLGHFNNAGTLTTTSLAAGNAIGQPFRASESATKGFVEFIASGTSVTNIFVNVFSVDPSTHAKTKLWGSANLAASIPGSLGYVKALIPTANQMAVDPGDNLLLELVNTGVNALNVVTTNMGAPNHPSDFPPNKGTTRVTASTGGAQPASLTDAQVTYSAITPYFNFGIANVPPGYMPPARTDFASSGTFGIPLIWQVAGNLIDLVPLGAGGGGGSAQSFNMGGGGQPGNWNPATYVWGSDVNGTGFPVITSTAITVTIGNPGTGGAAALGGNDGTSGGSTTFSHAGMTTLTATGGAGGPKGNNLPAANGPGNITYNGIPYFGGPNVAAGQTGGNPGGGGGGGASFSDGAGGFKGWASVTLRQP